MENDKKNKKVCCYLAGACDLICFVFGSYLFGLALIGRTYRNEISPRNLTLRMREFTQAELQIFFNPSKINYGRQRVVRLTKAWKKWAADVKSIKNDAWDHQKVHECTLVATRPISSTVKQVLSYEIPGITKIPFNPNIYEKIDKEFGYKKKAFQIYKSEVMKFPHPRSIESIENLAIYRGIESGLRKAEAFQLIRHVLDR